MRETRNTPEREMRDKRETQDKRERHERWTLQVHRHTLSVVAVVSVLRCLSTWSFNLSVVAAEGDQGVTTH